MSYTIKDIAEIIGEEAVIAKPADLIEHLFTDSRRVAFPVTSLFIALQGPRRNGENFIPELVEAGVRSFIVTTHFDLSIFTGVNFIIVNDPLRSLQKLAAYHRQQFTLPVVGITGSNGKTIVKEWLFNLLNKEYNIVRSPKSYNSQVGVPLSVWQFNQHHTLAIIEAGISQAGEIENLESIIQPTIGILTNIGAAHSGGFKNKEHKAEEKFKLFNNASTIVSNNLDPVINNVVLTGNKAKFFIWGDGDADLKIIATEKKLNDTKITACYAGKTISISIPFIDKASIENAITCWSLLLYLKIPDNLIVERMQQLESVEMRLQLEKATNNCSLINDSYSNDLSSLRIALDFLHQHAGKQKTTVILSDLGETFSSDEQYNQVLQALLQYKVKKFVGIGPRLHALRALFESTLPEAIVYSSVDSFIHHFSTIHFRDEAILLKGARSFRFEQINMLFEKKMHQTVLEVNLSAMAHNLKEYQRFLKPSTKVMAMVKAFSYGSGSAEVASVLQFHKVDYLAVAYADEGVELRKAGIHLPVMVMNPEPVTFQSLVDYNLEPEMYSTSIIKAFNNYLSKQGLQQFPVHIKIDTGMHRLGFEVPEIDELVLILKMNPRLVVKSVFSHLVASENAVLDTFTARQIELFLNVCEKIRDVTGYNFIRHIANSAAIFRLPQYQYEMVRLGIGLYGIDSTTQQSITLQPVTTLRTTIAQIRNVEIGETVGYNRKGLVTRDSLIATIRIGYADGFNRKLGNGVGKVYLNGKFAPVVGNVCMDMTMIDITDIEGVSEGDVVEIFGPNLPVEKLAKWCNTIPYEIMTGISQRVKREYFQE